MAVIVENSLINRESWEKLVQESSVATWFQTAQAYDFFAGLPFFEAFAVAVNNNGSLKGVVVGYVQKDGGKLKQFFSRRAIIIGGPLLSNDVSDEEIATLLTAVKTKLKKKAIYIETRNLHDYSQWRSVFEQAGFAYEQHLNFQVDCTDWETVEQNIGKHRRRYIRLSLRDGASVVEHPVLEQVRDYYSILEELYRTKVKRPLFPFCFFESLYKLDSCRFVLIEYEGKVIGGSVCVLLEDEAVYEWFACGQDGLYKNIHPSSLTKYAGMRYAFDNSYRVFDMMGAGKPDEDYGVRDFKAEFGGQLVEHGRFRAVISKSLWTLGNLYIHLIKHF